MSVLNHGLAKTSGGVGFYPTEITQSLRFEDGDSAYLSRTPSSDGDRTTWTWSGWVKRGNFDTHQTLFSSCSSATNGTFIRINEDNQLQLRHLDGGTASFSRNTVALLRDPSAWYHCVVAYDSNEALATDRIKMWINGTQITEFATGDNTPPSTKASDFNLSGRNNLLGTIATTSAFFDGYLAEVHFTDGTAYTADDFGELKAGIWVPKAPSVTYGTNGFYLDFADGAAIGDDESGNTNDFTTTNLVASDVVPDSPTNNFATWNSVDTKTVLSEGNLKSESTTSYLGARATFNIPSTGKWYWEGVVLDPPSGSRPIQFGVIAYTGNLSSSQAGLADSYFWLLEADRKIRVDGTTYSPVISGTGSSGDILQVAIDADAGEIYFGYNNTWYQTDGSSDGNPSTGTNPTVSSYDSSLELSPFIVRYDNRLVANFGQDSTFAGNKTAGGNSDANGIGDFAYAPPSGFLALCTANLPDPVIDPAQDATPEDHFNVVLWTGDTNDDRSITGVGFQPDLVWIKSRSTTWGHWLYDVVRGTGNTLQSESTNFESVNYTYGYLDAFETDGFGLQAGATSDDAVNANTHTYVAWNWKAGGTGVSNTDGSITSTVSANPDAGFSIVGYTGNDTSGSTIGHGLSQAPEMIIVKERSQTRDWTVYHKELGNTGGLRLNTTSAAETTREGWWSNTDPSSSVITLGGDPQNDWYQTNQTGQTYIAYCFHSVDGFSKVGSYVGNGSTGTSGPFVYLGFRPRFILVKGAVNDSASDWHIWDSERDGTNPINAVLYPNYFIVEDTTATYQIDMLSNGFKVTASNALPFNNNNATYIYYAIAEQPFKYSNSV